MSGDSPPPCDIRGRPAQPALLPDHSLRDRSGDRHGATRSTDRTAPGEQRRRIAGRRFWPAQPWPYGAAFRHRDHPLLAAGLLLASGRAGRAARVGLTPRTVPNPGTGLAPAPAGTLVPAPAFPRLRIEEPESPQPGSSAGAADLASSAGSDGCQPPVQCSRPAAHRHRACRTWPANSGRRRAAGGQRPAGTVRIRPAQAPSGCGHPTRHLVCTLGIRGQPQPGGLIINSLSRAAVDQRVSRAL